MRRQGGGAGGNILSEIIVPSGTGVGGSGVANQVAVWSGTTALSGSSSFTFDGTTLALTGLATFRKDQNSTSRYTFTNGSAGAAAAVEISLTGADDFNFAADGSGVGGPTATINSGAGFTGGLSIVQSGAHSIVIVTNSTTRATFDGAGAISFTGTVSATKNANSTTIFSMNNNDAGASAAAQIKISSNADDFNFTANSTAAGAVSQINSGSGFTAGLQIIQSGARTISFLANGNTLFQLVGSSGNALYRFDQNATSVFGHTNANAGSSAVIQSKLTTSAGDFIISATSTAQGGNCYIDASAAGFVGGLHLFSANAPIDFNVNGTTVMALIAGGQMQLTSAGTAGNPGYTLRSSNLGIYSPAANQLGFATAGLAAAFFDGSQILNFAASGNESTGAGTALLGTNSPASTLSAPYKWIKMKTSDASVVYVPVWK